MSIFNFFRKKKPPIEEEEIPCWNPPTADAARRRLMILWANDGRSYLEKEHAKGEETEEEPLIKLRDWIAGPLSPDATPHELSRHDDELGTYTPQEVLDDWWDVEAAVVLQWALGIIPEMPGWDCSADWGEAINELFDFPDPNKWRTDLTLRHHDEIEAMAQSYEARYWRVRMLDSPQNIDYSKKLMRRAASLGQVELTPDGDLVMTDGRAVTDLDEDELSYTTSILRERLHALNWLCGQEADWDDITCDTIVSWLWDENWKGA